MQDKPSLEDTLALMRDLRHRCEWDAAQTHDSLRPYLLEEAHELDAAIRSGDDAEIREELGDLLLQVLFHSVMAEERSAFSLHDVAESLITKMKRRHPHLYAGGAKEPWERMKAKKRTSIGAGLPSGLPALHRAQRLQERAAGLGFDWPGVEGPIDKIREELDEAREHLLASPPTMGPGGAPVLDARHAALEDELGDLLFSCVNLCRKAGVHSALALDGANAKFEARFAQVELLAKARGLVMGEASIEELDLLWDEAKEQV